MKTEIKLRQRQKIGITLGIFSAKKFLHENCKHWSTIAFAVLTMIGRGRSIHGTQDGAGRDYSTRQRPSTLLQPHPHLSLKICPFTAWNNIFPWLFQNSFHNWKVLGFCCGTAPTLPPSRFRIASILFPHPLDKENLTPILNFDPIPCMCQSVNM